jgi:hypothetical protein
VNFQTSHLQILVNLAKQEGWDLAEAREVETLDVFYDEEVWMKNKCMIEVLRQGMPEESRDIFIWEKEEAREVCYGFSCRVRVGD